MVDIGIGGEKITYTAKDITDADIIHAFPEDFISIIYKQELRELKLNKIL